MVVHGSHQQYGVREWLLSALALTLIVLGGMAALVLAISAVAARETDVEVRLAIGGGAVVVLALAVAGWSVWKRIHPIAEGEAGWWPRTVFGRWSVASMAAFWAAYGWFLALLAAGEEAETFWSNPRFSLVVTAAGVTGIASFVTGAIALLRRRERSPLVVTSAIVGLTVLMWVVTELFVPH